VDYYQEVIAKLGRTNADSFARLYMLPGVQHCGGGPGAGNIGQSSTWTAEDPQHNIRIALENWVEKGTAPGTIIATKTADDNPQSSILMTRPLCPYPEIAKYKGSGDSNKAESFVCANPKK
jgi:Tannase and feruloyl esterase